EHVHARETEVVYVLEGTGTMTVNGVALAIEPTSVVQVPPGATHSFTATSLLRALQIYAPAGPEQRFKRPAPAPRASGAPGAPGAAGAAGAPGARGARDAVRRMNRPACPSRSNPSSPATCGWQRA